MNVCFELLGGHLHTPEACHMKVFNIALKATSNQNPRVLPPLHFQEESLEMKIRFCQTTSISNPTAPIMAPDETSKS